MKKWLTVLMILLLSVSMMSCGSDSNRDALNFYVWGDATEVSWYEVIARDFKDETGITVNVIPTTGDYYENLNVYLGSAKDAPDIFFTEQGEILSQMAAGQLLNLSPYIESGELDVKTDANQDAAIELWDINDVYRYDGEVFGSGDYMALIKDWSPDFMLWYNKNHIDEYNDSNGYEVNDDGFIAYPDEDVPMSWEEFMDVSHKLTVYDGDQFMRYGTMLDRVPWKHLMEWIQMTGTETFIDGKYFNADAEGVEEAFQYFAALQKGPKASAPVIGPTGIGSGEAFANGDLSFAWFGSWAYSAYHFDNVGFELGIAPPPVPSNGEPLTEDDCYGVAAGMIALAINKNTPLVDEAVQFLNFYMTNGSEYMAEKGFNIPGNLKVARSDAYLQSDRAFIEYMNNYFLEFAMNHTHPLKYNQYISQLTVENQMSKHFSTWINNYDPDTLDDMLESLEEDIRNEID